VGSVINNLPQHYEHMFVVLGIASSWTTPAAHSPRPLNAPSPVAECRGGGGQQHVVRHAYDDHFLLNPGIRAKVERSEPGQSAT
jgi:hypothetical protein